MRLAYRARSLCALLALTIGCSHEVIVLGPAEAPVVPAEPLGLTVSIYPGSFDRTRLQERGVLDRFVDEIREQRIFQAVLHPVPSGKKRPSGRQPNSPRGELSRQKAGPRPPFPPLQPKPNLAGGPSRLPPA